MFIYRLVGIIILILTGSVLFSSPRLKLNFLGFISRLILLIWFGILLHYQIPSYWIKQKYHIQNYGFIHPVQLDKIYELPQVYAVSRDIASFYSSGYPENILLVFPHELAQSMRWDDAAYWEWRLKYRNYPIRFRPVFLDAENQYHDFLELHLRNRPGFEPLDEKNIISQNQIKLYYPHIIYIRPEPKYYPDGYQILFQSDNIIILERETD